MSLLQSLKLIGRTYSVIFPKQLRALYFYQVISIRWFSPSTYLDIAKIHVLQKPKRNFHEGISRPGPEPINLGAVDETREAATSRPEGISHGRKAENHVQVGPNPERERRTRKISGVASVVNM